MPSKEAPFKRLMNSYTVNEITGCWEWTASLSGAGYGQIKVFGKMRTAHRYSFELHNGEIPPDLSVMHVCDVKKCINPDHLKLGTHAENLADAAQKGLMRSGENHPRFRNPLRKGITSTQSIQVLVKGKRYGSIKEAEAQLNVPSGTVRYWLNKKPEIAQKITREEFINAQ